MKEEENSRRCLQQVDSLRRPLPCQVPPATRLLTQWPWGICEGAKCSFLCQLIVCVSCTLHKRINIVQNLAVLQRLLSPKCSIYHCLIQGSHQLFSQLLCKGYKTLNLFHFKWHEVFFFCLLVLLEVL